jgi:hypothetical protein
MRRLGFAALVAGLSASCARHQAASKAEPPESAPATRVATTAGAVAPPRAAPSSASAPPPSADIAGPSDRARALRLAAAKKPATYSVFGVGAKDVLNVRAKADPAAPKLTELFPAPRASQCQSTGVVEQRGQELWLEVRIKGGTGWVNRSFLLEQPASAGCKDPKLQSLVERFAAAVGSENSAALAALASPVRGLLVRLDAWNSSVAFLGGELEQVFQSAAPRFWGRNEQTEQPISGSFKKLVLPSLQKTLGIDAKRRCGQLLVGSSTAPAEWPSELSGLTLMSFHHAGKLGPDWTTWVLAVEYVDSEPYAAALVRYRWQI